MTEQNNVAVERDAEKRGEQRMLARLIMAADAIAFQAGVGGRETAGAIASYLATSPDEIEPFVAGTLSPMDFKGDWIKGGCLSWHAAKGDKIIHPDDPAQQPQPNPELEAHMWGEGKVARGDVADLLQRFIEYDRARSVHEIEWRSINEFLDAYTGLPILSSLTPPPISVMTVVNPDEWEPCSPSYLARGGSCRAPRVWNAETMNHWHPKVTPPTSVDRKAVLEEAVEAHGKALHDLSSYLTPLLSDDYRAAEAYERAVKTFAALAQQEPTP